MNRCFACTQNRLEKPLRRRDKIKVAIENLKSGHSTAFLMVKDLSDFYAMLDIDNREEASASTKWLKSTKVGHVRSVNIELLVSEKVKGIEKPFVLNVFVHACNEYWAKLMRFQMDVTG